MIYTGMAGRIVRSLQGDRFVYSAQAWQKAAALTMRRIPITSPPITAETFLPAWMERKHILYFKLHGFPNDPDWYGMDTKGERVKALTSKEVRMANLRGAIVIAVVCYGAAGPMERAFIEAGAIAFFGSPDEVRARETERAEADKLAAFVVQALAQNPQNLTRVLADAKDLYSQNTPEFTEHDVFTLDTWTVQIGGRTYA